MIEVWRTESEPQQQFQAGAEIHSLRLEPLFNINVNLLKIGKILCLSQLLAPLPDLHCILDPLDLLDPP